MKRIMLLLAFLWIFCIVLSFALGIDLVKSSPSSKKATGESPKVDWWPMFQHDPAHTDHSLSKVPEANKTLWMTEKDDYPTIKGVANAASLPEILDQQQTDFSRPVNTRCLAQSFKPTLTVLTRVDFYLATTTGSATLSVYSSTTTESGLRPASQLRSMTIPIPNGGLYRWAEFVPSSPISVVPENTYFLVIIFPEIEQCLASTEDLYPRGEACLFAEISGDPWRFWATQPWDFPFKTYGYTPALTIHTSGVSSHSPVVVTLNRRSAGMVWDSSPLEVSDNIIWDDGYCTVIIGIDRARILSIDPNSRYFFTNWTGSPPAYPTTDNPLTIWLSQNFSFTANFRMQYSSSIMVKDNSGTIGLDPTYIETLAPNGSLVTFSSFTNQWMDSGTWTLKRVMWQGNNVTPLTASVYTPTSGGEWIINCRVFLVNFTESFKDSDGTDLYVKPSSFKLDFPNGTTSASLSLGSYLVQNGTTSWSSIIWQGSEVTPGTNFDASDGNPVVNCEVYSSAVDPSFYDNTGTTPIQPSSWALRFPNGTVRTLSSPVTYNQTQTGSYSMESVVWKGRNVLQQSISIFITSNNIWSPRIVCILPTSARAAPLIETPLGKVLIFGIPITAIVVLVVFYVLKKKQQSP